MTKQDQIKELTEVIHKDYPEVNAEHIATLAVEWFNVPDEFIEKLCEWSIKHPREFK